MGRERYAAWESVSERRHRVRATQEQARSRPPLRILRPRPRTLEEARQPAPAMVAPPRPARSTTRPVQTARASPGAPRAPCPAKGRAPGAPDASAPRRTVLHKNSHAPRYRPPHTSPLPPCACGRARALHPAPRGARRARPPLRSPRPPPLERPRRARPASELCATLARQVFTASPSLPDGTNGPRGCWRGPKGREDG